MARSDETEVWTQHAKDCRDQGRKPFIIDKNDYFMVTVQGLKKKGVRRVLDLGCGPGYWSSLFKGMDYTGWDQNQEMIKLAREVSPKLKFVCAPDLGFNILKPIFEPGSFDMVFTAGVLQHNANSPEKWTLVKHISQLLKSGSYLFMTENTLTPENTPACVNDTMYTDGYSFTKDGWIKFIESLGFILIEYHFPSEYVFSKV